MEEWFTPAFIVAIALFSALCAALLFAVVLQDLFHLDPAQIRLQALALASVAAGSLFGEMVLAKCRSGRKDRRRR